MVLHFTQPGLHAFLPFDGTLDWRRHLFHAIKNHQVIGAVSIAIRTLKLPDGAHHTAAYVGDLKIDPGGCHPLALLRLAQRADAWARPRVTAAYGIVMDGTRQSPVNYTGRMGIEPFHQIAKVIVLRLTTNDNTTDTADDTANDTAESHCCALADEVSGNSLFKSLSQNAHVASGGTPAARSLIEPVWMMHHNRRAVGRLEDTRRAKRLIGDDGIEMNSAHLACFACGDPISGAELIQFARHRAAVQNFPALFVALSETDFPSIDAALGSVDRTVAPATVFGAGLQASANWNVNTSEI